MSEAPLYGRYIWAMQLMKLSAPNSSSHLGLPPAIGLLQGPTGGGYLMSRVPLSLPQSAARQVPANSEYLMRRFCEDN